MACQLVTGTSCECEEDGAAALFIYGAQADDYMKLDFFLMLCFLSGALQHVLQCCFNGILPKELCERGLRR